jgi:glycosyltransferase involved in cell wall biosynthesis
MRVTHVYKDYFPPVYGGIEQHLNALCGGLAAKGVDVRVLVANRRLRTSIETIDGVRVIRAACLGRLTSAPLSLSLPVWIRRLDRDSDVYHFHFPNPVGEVAAVLGMTRRPFVATYHSDIVRQRYAMPVYGAVVRRFLRRARRIVVASPNHVSMSPFLRGVADRSVVIPYGIDPQWLSAPPNGVADVWRKRLGQPLVLFVGRFRHYKGLDVLLSAMTRVRASLALVGSGAGETALREQVRRLGLDGRVTFLGHVEGDKLRALYHACDVFVLPSTNKAEAFGLVQVEAMACGRPVVSTALGTGTTFVNLHDVTGLVVTPKDAPALAAAIQRLLDDPDLRRRMGSAGRERVAREFTLDRMVERTLALYTEVAAGTPRGEAAMAGAGAGVTTSECPTS